MYWYIAAYILWLADESIFNTPFDYINKYRELFPCIFRNRKYDYWQLKGWLKFHYYKYNHSISIRNTLIEHNYNGIFWHSNIIVFNGIYDSAETAYDFLNRYKHKTDIYSWEVP